MVRSILADVEPTVLRWARESIHLTEVAAARKIGVPDGRVVDWESGSSRPTITQLRAAAEVYKRPLAVFFLSEPPRDFDTLRDFRRLAGSDAGNWSPALHADFRRAHVQRDAALELADLDDDPPPADWRIDPLPDSDDAIADAVRRHLLGLGPLALPTGAADRPYEHLNAWVAALEAAGVLVLATAGGRVLLEEMRAFSLYFDVLPVIVVNGKDSPRGRLFSLLHEYAHLLLHTEGLCDTVSDLRATTPNRILEARCNAIAATALMPAATVLATPLVRGNLGGGRPAWTYSDLRNAAAPFGVSAEAFLRRLVTLGQIDEAFYSARRDEFVRAYSREETARSQGGDWYRNTARDLGKGFVRQVADAHRRRVIDSYTAATFLNVKAHQMPRLAKAASLTTAV